MYYDSCHCISAYQTPNNMSNVVVQPHVHIYMRSYEVLSPQTNYPNLLSLCLCRTYEVTSKNSPRIIIQNSSTKTFFPNIHLFCLGPALQLQSLILLHLFLYSPNNLLLVKKKRFFTFPSIRNRIHYHRKMHCLLNKRYHLF